MSSPLLLELREKRGLVYHAACNADRFEFGGQLAIEASFAPKHLNTVLRETVQLVRRHAERVDPVDLERARSQVIVRLMRHDERLTQRTEDAALDLFALQRVRNASRARGAGACDQRRAGARRVRAHAARRRVGGAHRQRGARQHAARARGDRRADAQVSRCARSC